MKTEQKKFKKEKPLVIGTFPLGCRIFLQECKKCHAKHKSDHLLFICQVDDCDGSMTGELD